MQRRMNSEKRTRQNAFVRAATAMLGGISAALLATACATNLNSVSVTPPADGIDANTASLQSGPKKPLTIAMILPLTGFGRAAIIGKSLKQAGELALFESGNPGVQLIVKNDDGNAGAAATAAQQAIAEGAEIIVGPLFGASVPSVAAVARPADVPVLALSNDRTVAGGGVYVMSDLPEAETERVVSFAISRGKRRFAALIPTGAYGDAVEPAFRNAVMRGGGTIIASERFEPGANAMLKPAKRIFEIINQAAETATPVDALFLPGDQTSLTTLGPQIAYAKIDLAATKVLGLSGWEYPGLDRNKNFTGAWYAGQDPAEWQAFAQRFALTFGQAPPRLAARAYEAVSLAISLSDKPKGQRFTQANLTMPSGFQGVNGRFSLNLDGTSQRTIAILEVQPHGAIRIDGGSTVTPDYSSQGLAATPSPMTYGRTPAAATQRRELPPVQPIARRPPPAAPL